MNRRIFIFLVALLVSLSAFAQAEVTKFLGIPVDGTKAQMMAQLKAKGFTSVPGQNDMLQGEFNGQEVYVRVHTNNKKVWRICVWDQNTFDEGQIRINFNTLCYQFQRNPRYVCAIGDVEDFLLSDTEDINYQIAVNHKLYDAYFRQKSEAINFDSLVWFRIGQDQHDEFFIALFYENLKNAANGDDL